MLMKGFSLWGGTCAVIGAECQQPRHYCQFKCDAGSCRFMETKAKYREVAKGLFICETAIKMPAASLPLNGTAIKLGDGRVVVISPLNPKRADYESLRRLGEVAHIVSPNSFHNLFAAAAKKEFPNAILWAAPALRKRKPEIPWDAVIGKDGWPFAGELDCLYLEGAPGMGEVVFLHRATKTLIVTDLFFNLKNVTALGARFLFTLMGTLNRFASSRLLNLVMRDKPRFLKCLEILMSWDFDRIIMAHGEPVECGGKRMAQAALEKRLGIDLAAAEHKGHDRDATI